MLRAKNWWRRRQSHCLINQGLKMRNADCPPTNTPKSIRLINCLKSNRFYRSSGARHVRPWGDFIHLATSSADKVLGSSSDSNKPVPLLAERRKPPSNSAFTLPTTAPQHSELHYTRRLQALWPQPGAVPYRQDIDCVSNFVSHNVRFVNYQFTSAFNPTRSACIRIGG